MKALLIKHRARVQVLTPAALDAALIDSLQMQVLVIAAKYVRARNKYIKWKYKQQVHDLNARIAELSADTSIKLTN